MPDPRCSFEWKGPDEAAEADKVETEEQLLRFATTGYANPQRNAAITQKARGNEPLEECA